MLTSPCQSFSTWLLGDGGSGLLCYNGEPQSRASLQPLELLPFHGPQHMASEAVTFPRGSQPERTVDASRTRQERHPVCGVLEKAESGT